jgi:uncharacterized protein (DUF779 family)
VGSIDESIVLPSAGLRLISRGHGYAEVVRISASEQSEAVVRKVAASGREDLMMVLGTGCCDSTAPFLYDRYYPGPDVVEVGRVAGVPILAHRWLADLYAEEDGLEIDVNQDAVSDSFSLETEHGCRLTLRLAESGSAP